MDLVVTHYEDGQEFTEKILKKIPDLADFLFKVLQGRYFFSYLPQYNAFLYKFIQLIGEEEKEKMLDRICEEFIREDNVLFFQILPDLFNRMILNKFSAQKFIQIISENIAQMGGELEELKMKRIMVLYHILNKQGSLQNKEHKIFRERFHDILQITFWIIKEKLYLYSSVFQTALNNQLDLLLKIALMDNEFTLGTELYDLIKLCHENQVLGLIKNNFHQFLMSSVMKEQQSSKNIQKLTKQFYLLIKENIFDEGY